jgi:hypothetical protein
LPCHIRLLRAVFSWLYLLVERGAARSTRFSIFFEMGRSEGDGHFSRYREWTVEEIAAFDALPFWRSQNGRGGNYFVPPLALKRQVHCQLKEAVAPDRLSDHSKVPRIGRGG